MAFAGPGGLAEKGKEGRCKVRRRMKEASNGPVHKSKANGVVIRR